jgi:thiosulfate reductase/polysulfide reductase chain A
MRIGLSCVTGTAIGIRGFPQTAPAEKATEVSRTSLRPLMGIPTTCEICPAKCGIIAYLNGERLVQILGNPFHPNNRGRICAKGIAGINLVNDPERILYPLKRTGSRGSGQWTRITWDEVYLTLTSRLKSLIAGDKIDEYVVDIGHPDVLLDHFNQSYGISNVINRPVLKNQNRSSVWEAMTGSPSLIPDVARTRFILNFGANPYAHHDYFIGLARRLVDARLERGARLVTFDVRMSETGAKSDEWHPLRPGTDGILALALAHVIVKKDLADNDFIEAKTNTSIPQLKSHLLKYTPERAEKESGIKAEDIERLATSFAKEKSSLALIGGGAIDHENGSQNARCITLLNALVGNLEKEGGIFFPRLPEVQGSQSRDWLEYLVRPRNSLRSISEIKKPVDIYFAYLSNPVYSDLDPEESARILNDEKTIRFLVVMDTHMTETARLADLVLPAATYLEGWGLSLAPSLDRISVINLRQPAVSLVSPAKVLRSPVFEVGKILEPTFHPRGDSKEIGNILLELARRIDKDTHRRLPWKNTQDYSEKMISDFSVQKENFQSLKEKGLWKSPFQPPPSHPEQMKIFDQGLRENGKAPLPVYQPIPSHQKKNADQFVLTTFHSNMSAKGTENSKWVREILHENRLWMNKDRASQLGIKNGDRVRITSSLGHLEIHVLTTERIHPESVALAEGMGHTAVGNTAQARRFRSKDRDSQLIWWNKEGKGVNPFQIIEKRVDRTGGGLASKDTLVQIHKVEES